MFRALELGAVDFIAKPTRGAAPELVSIEGELLRKVHAVRELRLDALHRHALRGGAGPAAAPGAPLGPDAPRVVALGASTGGPAALMEILAGFAAAPPIAFLVAQHMPAGFTRDFAARLDRLTAFCAREAAGGEEPAPGGVLVAPGGCHLEVEAVAGRVRARVVPSGADDRFAPSVDRLFESAAKAYGPGLLAVVLTGMGDDGSRGVLAVKAGGGAVVAESERTAVIHGMPGQAIRTGAVDRVLPLPEIAAAIRGGVRPAPAGKGVR